MSKRVPTSAGVKAAPQNERGFYCITDSLSCSFPTDLIALIRGVLMGGKQLWDMMGSYFNLRCVKLNVFFFSYNWFQMSSYKGNSELAWLNKLISHA